MRGGDRQQWLLGLRAAELAPSDQRQQTQHHLAAAVILFTVTSDPAVEKNLTEEAATERLDCFVCVYLIVIVIGVCVCQGHLEVMQLSSQHHRHVLTLKTHNAAIPGNNGY